MFEKPVGHHLGRSTSKLSVRHGSTIHKRKINHSINITDFKEMSSIHDEKKDVGQPVQRRKSITMSVIQGKHRRKSLSISGMNSGL